MNREKAEKLFNEHVKWAKAIAKAAHSRLKGRRITEQQAIQAGLIGLWMACKRFESSKADTFKQYAKKSITNSIIDEGRLYMERRKDSLSKIVGRDEDGNKLTLSEELPAGESSDAQAIRNDSAKRLLRPLNRQERTIAKQFIIQGRSYDEMAEKQGVCLNTMRKRIEGVMAKLRSAHAGNNTADR